MRKYRTWHEVLVEQLADSDEALDYLQFSLEEYQRDGGHALLPTGPADCCRSTR